MGLLQYIFSVSINFMFITLWIGIIVFNSLELVGDRLKSSFYDHEDTFDFIVVGGGSAGAVVASRLSENYKTLLLEAGGIPNPMSSIPNTAMIMLNQPKVDWQMLTVPQKNSCLAMKQQRSLWSSGRGLGGSSNLNFLIYARGHPEDYNNWARQLNSSIWSYENVLKYFKKSENYECTEELDEETKKYHAKGGYLTVRYPDYTGMADYFVKAGKELGYPTIDYNGNFSEGFAVTQYVQQQSSFRMGTYSAFIQPTIKNKSNLTVYKFSYVHKVLFEPGTNRVYGVEYSRHGQTKIAYANKEVILSAGAINSAKILMASGIGPKEHLESLEIPVIKDLPVGKNLQDHVGTFLQFVINDSVSFIPSRDVNPYSVLDMFLNGKGVLTSSTAQATAFLTSTRAKKEERAGWPDLQMILIGGSFYDFYAWHLENAFNSKEGIFSKYLENLNGQEGFSIIPLLGRPKSRGEVLLSSKDPRDPPLINPKYFDEESDMKTLVEGVRFTVDLVENTTAFKGLKAKLYNNKFPGCEKHEFKSDSYYECLVRHITLTIYHPAGTCSMGKEDSKDAVVNSKLQVIGIENLRVADASVMPNLISANTNAPCIMIGEIGADLIKKKYSKDSSTRCTNTNQNQKYYGYKDQKTEL